jgi:hypothetical protein
MPRIPATLELEIGRVMVGCQSRQKARVAPSQPIKAGPGDVPVFPAMQEGKMGGSQSKPAWAKTQDPS